MKLPVCLSIIVSFLAIGCERSPTPLPTATLPFEYTNLIHQPSVIRPEPGAETIITFTNLVWFGHSHDQISMGLGPTDYDITVSFDRTNRTVHRVVQSKRVNGKNLMIIDSDGDGIPEQKSNLTDKETEILLQGEWHPMRRDGSLREALVNSNWIQVRFENGRWQPTAQEQR